MALFLFFSCRHKKYAINNKIQMFTYQNFIQLEINPFLELRSDSFNILLSI
jgi:hypothetical protein